MLDSHADVLIESNINMSVPYYLMASYAYYVQDDPIFSDGYYDELAKTILANWDNITHRHRDVLKKDDLVAGSFLGEYPSIIESALDSLRKETAPKKRKRNKKVMPKPVPVKTMGEFGSFFK